MWPTAKNVTLSDKHPLQIWRMYAGEQMPAKLIISVFINIPQPVMLLHTAEHEKILYLMNKTAICLINILFLIRQELF